MKGKKRLLLILTILFLFASCEQKVLDCRKFKNGKFLYHWKFDNEDFFYLIIREGRLQWEVNQKTGDTATYRVKWTGECSYDLYLQKNSNDSINLQIKESDRLPVKTQILATADNYYLFKARHTNVAFTLTDTIWLKK